MTYENTPAEIVKHFIFSSKTRGFELENYEELEILVPEILQAGYSFYTWPCANILAWYLWERRSTLIDKRILEIGSGTSLPGILAAKCGARVILSDSGILHKSLAHIKKCCRINKLEPNKDIEIIGLSWGILLNNIFNLGSLDFIIASDCFYDPIVFEDILVTISFLLDFNSGAKFIFTYQERSSDWSIEPMLKKWNLHCVHISTDLLGQQSTAFQGDLNIGELIKGHTINLLEISK